MIPADSRPPIHRLVIVGGGTAGWMVAAGLSRMLGSVQYAITLVESDEIGTVGVGEATIPMLRLYLDLLGIDEHEFLRETNGTYKLGIAFADWRRVGESYFHPFGGLGRSMEGIEFIHYWLRLQAMGGNPDFGRFNAETMAARENRFTRTEEQPGGGDRPAINHAYQFDAGLFARYLRRFAEARGVVRREGKVVGVERQGETGHVASLAMADGGRVAGDLFIDCSGFRALLIGETLDVPFEDWGHWLPCDTAVAVPCASPAGPITPYTRATALEAGWQWRIPLQHRMGNGYVFASAFLDPAAATERLLGRLEGAPLRDPKILRFRAGHRARAWEGNVVAVGLAGGFLEPLESTAIYLVQIALSKLLAHLPKAEIVPGVVAQFNREIAAEYRGIRDFLIAHYHVTERDDTPFWRHCRTMTIPDSLAERLEIFRRTANCNSLPTELFKDTSWFAVLVGQGLVPQAYHPIADVISEDELRLRLSRWRSLVSERVASLSSHDEYLRRHCAARPD